MNKRLIVTLGALVVAAGIGFIALRGYPPQQGVEGAIGAANRYSENQITDSDVTVTDAEIQAFLQSDLFHKMQTDADFRQSVLDNRSVLADGQFMRAIDPLLSRELDAVRTVAADGGFWKIADAQTINALRLDAMTSSLDALAEISDAAMSKIAEDNLPEYFPGNRRVDVGADWMSSLSDNAKSLVSDGAFWSKVGSDNWQAMVVSAQKGQLDALVRKTGFDMNAAQLDAMREISDAAMSKIAEDNLPEYFPGNRRVDVGADWMSSLSDNAKSLIADNQVWSALGADGWTAIVDARISRKLDGLTQIIDGYGYKMDGSSFSLDAMRIAADGNRTKLSMDAQAALADAKLFKLVGDRAQALVDASMARTLDDFTSKLDAAKSTMDAGTFKMDAYRTMDGQVWKAMDAAHWAAVDAAGARLPDYAKVLTSDEFAKTVASDGFASRLTDGAYVSALSASDFWSVLSDDQFASKLADGKMSKIISTDRFTSAISE